MSDLAFVLSQYSVGELQESQLIEQGLIHGTWKVTTTQGAFCLQRLHPVLSNDKVAQDYEVVTRFLQQQEFPAPRLFLTREGNRLFDDADGKRWRLTSWLEGRSVSTFSSDAQVLSAAALLGRFHNTMTELEYDFASEHPLHDTKLHLARLSTAVEKHSGSEWWPQVETLVEEVQTLLTPMLLSDSLPQRVVHGDPKVSNFLFHPEETAVALIDLDTCSRHSVLVDLGDAVRSWCREGSEDEEQHFLLARFQLLLNGYATTAPALTEEELEGLVTAGPMITLELTARFLTDVLEDSYFGWDANRYESRRHHNLARAKGMLFLAKSMLGEEEAVQKIIKNAFMTR